MATTDKKEGLKASDTCMVVQNEKISTKNGESPADNIVRESNISILTSHAGLNPRSKSGNESSFAGELSSYIPGRHRKLSDVRLEGPDMSRLQKGHWQSLMALFSFVRLNL